MLGIFYRLTPIRLRRLVDRWRHFGGNRQGHVRFPLAQDSPPSDVGETLRLEDTLGLQVTRREE